MGTLQGYAVDWAGAAVRVEDDSPIILDVASAAREGRELRIRRRAGVVPASDRDTLVVSISAK